MYIYMHTHRLPLRSGWWVLLAPLRPGLFWLQLSVRDFQEIVLRKKRVQKLSYGSGVHFLRPRVIVGCPAAAELWSPGRWGLVSRHREGVTATPCSAAAIGWNGRLAVFAGTCNYLAVVSYLLQSFQARTPRFRVPVPLQQQQQQQQRQQFLLFFF